MIRRVGVVGALVVVLAAAGVVVVRAVGSGSDRPVAQTTPGTTSPTPTAQPSTPSSTPTVSTPPVSTPTASTPTVNATTAALAAQNRILLRNPLYGVGRLPASHCKEPTVRPTSVANVRKYYAEFVRCLDKAWAPVVRKAGFTFRSPRVEVFTGPSRTLCSVTDSAAYCGGVISMSADFDLKNYRQYDKLWTRTTMAHLVAHEYAHHIQALTGISAAAAERATYLNGVEANLQDRRRLELQASCLSGVYLGADRRYFPVSGSWKEKWVWTIRHRGDEWGTVRDHGDSSSHSKWTRRGFDAGAPSACNTYTASAASVA
ncbi:neutral zinc metallopeptidase [Kribbella sp. NPDC054772]